MLHTPKMAKAIGFSGGTPLYLGERVMKGASLAITDCKADIFALGVTFYSIIDKSPNYYINNSSIRSQKKYSSNQLFKDAAPLLEQMLNETKPSERPSINAVLRFILGLIQKMSSSTKKSYFEKEQ